jgi:tetratricopeptide (TPR) repeat protein
MLALETPDKHYLLHQAKDAYMALDPCEKVYINLASLLVKLESYADAKEIYEIMINTYPSASVFLNYGNLCYKIKEFKKSEELFLEAIERGSKKAIINYGWQLHGQQQFHNALFYYRIALNQDPDITIDTQAKIHSNIGLLYHERFITGHYECHLHQAEANYLECLELVEDQKDTKELLSILRSGSILEFWSARDTLFA